MALLTPISAETAARLAQTYGLVLGECVPLAKGSVNSNFLLRDAQGRRFFLRLYEEQDMAGAAREVELMHSLTAASVPCARPIARSDGAWLCEEAGKPVALFEWVEGDSVCQTQVTAALCFEIGAALGRVHRIPAGSLEEGRFRPSDLQKRLDFIETNGAPELVDAARAIRERLERHVAARDEELPKGLVHGDLFRDNVLWHEGKLAALLDFESASRGPFAYDLMVTILAWCYGSAFELELVRAMLAGYGSTRPLSPAELRALPSEGAIAALRFATTRITDFSMRAAPGASPGRDYRRFLARLDALEGGVLQPIVKAGAG